MTFGERTASVSSPRLHTSLLRSEIGEAVSPTVDCLAAVGSQVENRLSDSLFSFSFKIAPIELKVLEPSLEAGIANLVFVSPWVLYYH